MLVFRGFDDFRPLPRPSAVAVGNFDGLHLGHLRILARLCRLAESRGLSSLVLTFDPHPERALGKKVVRMIDTPEQRLARLRETCVDAVLVTKFDKAFARLSGRQFVEGILKDRLGAQEVVVGRDFHFGRDRRAGLAELQSLGRRAGIGVTAVPPEVVAGAAASSSLIRRLILQGRVDQAAAFLGRPYEIAGEVVQGISRGRRLGVPTANIRTANEILPDGVFISETVWRDRVFPSVTSIGRNPTFGRHRLSVETHILDARPRLYGARLTVRLLRKIRPTLKFRDSLALAEQIRKDVEIVRDYFRRPG
jgi:riboflavin kinase/FMN adenylyltransferase